MQAIGRQPFRASDGAPVHYEHHRPEQTTLYRLVQQHAASFIGHTESSIGVELPRFIKDEFDAVLKCGILTHRLPPLILVLEHCPSQEIWRKGPRVSRRWGR